MKYFVYLIINIKDGKSFSYVGYTNDVKKRLFLHNHSKGAKFTKGRIWELIYFRKYSNKSDAMKGEYKLKKDKKKREHIKEKFLDV